MDDINNYIEAYRCGNVPEKIQEKNIAYKERKRILNGENKNYY